jgi:hypothetical protein
VGPDFGSEEPPEVGLHGMGACDHDPEERRPNPALWPFGDTDPLDAGAAAEVMNGAAFPFFVIESPLDLPGGGGDDDNPFDRDDRDDDPFRRLLDGD